MMNIKTLCASGAGLLTLAAARGPARAEDRNPLNLSPQHATISVADLDKEEAWFETVLGFRALARFDNDPNLKIHQMGIPGFRIDLVLQKGSVRHRVNEGPLDQGWLHVVFKTPDIERDLKILQAKGVAVKTVMDKGAISRLTLHDPEDNEIEILNVAQDNTQ